MKLTELYLVKLESVINIACHICLFPISEYKRVYHVYERVKKNNISVDDIDGIMYVINHLINHKEVNDLLRADLEDLKKYINIRIAEFSYIPPVSCVKVENIYM